MIVGESMYYLVEVGAHTGSDTIGILMNLVDFQSPFKLYCFEPAPYLYGKLKEKFSVYDNVQVFDYAIDISDGEKNFFVGNEVEGLGSLYEFHPNLLNTPLKKRKAYHEIPRKINVKTIRLDTWMNLNDIPHLDFLWIDAQGNDFNCLLSLGERLKDIKEGRCETTFEIPIYKDANNYFVTVKSFLESQGFKVEIEYIHDHKMEIDLHFWKGNLWKL